MATANSRHSGITVKIARYNDRPNFIMYYDDPLTGKRPTKSSETSNEREARKAAAKWEAELNDGKYRPPVRATWEIFRDQFMQQHVRPLTRATYAAYATALNSLETTCHPARPADVTDDRLSYFADELRKQEKSEDTIGCYLRHIKAALRWAVTQRMMTPSQMPAVKMPKRVKGSKRMKGRPITGEEFDRLLAKVEDGLFEPLREKSDNQPKRKFSFAPEVVAERRRKAAAAAPSWQHLLRGLWLSGLRRAEALDLSWDDPRHIMVRLSGRRPMLVILGECQKSGKDQLLPITPDFAAFLEATPEADRTGPVFRPVSLDGEIVTDHYVGKRIAKMGRLARVKVADRQGKIKYASAHDLRRSFGFRWAMRVMPAVLKELMRHEDIATTMAYYVGQNAEGIADAVWAAAEKINISVNTAQPTGDKQKNSLA